MQGHGAEEKEQAMSRAAMEVERAVREMKAKRGKVKTMTEQQTEQVEQEIEPDVPAGEAAMATKKAKKAKAVKAAKPTRAKKLVAKKAKGAKVKRVRAAKTTNGTGRDVYRLKGEIPEGMKPSKARTVLEVIEAHGGAMTKHDLIEALPKSFTYGMVGSYLYQFKCSKVLTF